MKMRIWHSSQGFPFTAIPPLKIHRRRYTRAQRRSVLEKALEALGIAAPVAVRWYKKANGRIDAPIQREKIGHASIGLLFTLPPIVMEVKHGVFPLVFYTP